MKLKTIKDLENIEGKRVLVRVDFNVPLNKNLKVQDDSRILAALPTIKFLIDKKAKIILMSHLGRPKGEIINDLKLNGVSNSLSELIGKKVLKLDQTVGEKVEKALAKLQNKEIALLENTRFHKEEKQCNENFSQKLAKLADIFVFDAFGTAHRSHASTYGITKFLPTYAGLLMEKEIDILSPIVESKPEKPLTLIFGGAKMDTKIPVIKNFIDKADNFLLGGALANTFLAAAGYNIGDSLYEEDKIETAREIMLECEKHQDKLIIPHDLVVSDEISETAKTLNVANSDITGKMKILDIGKWTSEKFNNILEKSKTVIWNGPLGLCEYKPFQNGTKNVAEFLSKQSCTSIIGGGDTADALKRLNIDEGKFTHISTGGGACLEFLSGKKLPIIETLTK